ncbi:MAG: hypothetical protein WCF59_01540, partial [Desulfobaccales bacterium]
TRYGCRPPSRPMWRTRSPSPSIWLRTPPWRTWPGAYRLAYQLDLRGITVYRYGSKPGQVLSLPSESRALTLSQEFAEVCRLCSI